MRNIIVFAICIGLVFLFFHLNRIDKVERYYNEAIAILDEDGVDAGHKSLKRLDRYSGYGSLEDRIAEYWESFYLKIRDDMLEKAKNKEYGSLGYTVIEGRHYVFFWVRDEGKDTFEFRNHKK